MKKRNESTRSFIYKGLIVCLLLSASSRLVAQKIESDTIRNLTLTRKSWGIGLGYGFSTNMLDSKTAKYLSNPSGLSMNFAMYHKNCYFGMDMAICESRLKRDLMWENYPYMHEGTDMSFEKMAVFFGYDYPISKMFGVDGFVEYNNTSIYQSEDYSNSESIAQGFGYGAQFNSFFKVWYFSYLQVFVNASMNHVDMSQIYKGYGSFYSTVSLGVSYKGWFSRLK